MYTKEEQKEIDKINKMSQIDMCRLWKHAPSGLIYFDTSYPYFKIFNQRLHGHFNGFTPQISKLIG
jgi:hypothetical protein